MRKARPARHSTFATGFAGTKLVCTARKNVSEFDKAAVIQTVAEVQKDFGGQVHTGCHMNTTPDDMVSLHLQVLHVARTLCESPYRKNRGTD